MFKLKLVEILDDKPVKVTVEIPTQVYRDLAAYAEVLRLETDQVIDPAKLIVPMLKRFISSDRAFSKAKRIYQTQNSHEKPLNTASDGRDK